MRKILIFLFLGSWFWFLPRVTLAQTWGPGILTKMEERVVRTPLFDRYYQLIKKSGWWFCQRRQGCVLKGDANCDGRVDILDYEDWFSSFVRSQNKQGKGDFNCDGRLTIDDYQIWWENYSSSR